MVNERSRKAGIREVRSSGQALKHRLKHNRRLAKAVERQRKGKGRAVKNTRKGSEKCKKMQCRTTVTPRPRWDSRDDQPCLTYPQAISSVGQECRTCPRIADSAAGPPAVPANAAALQTPMCGEGAHQLNTDFLTFDRLFIA